jgi:thymidine phosphorylase
MSKKIVENSDALVLDVKTGSGSYNPSRESAVALATAMVSAGEAAHKPTVAFVTIMCVCFACRRLNQVVALTRSSKGPTPRSSMGKLP